MILLDTDVCIELLKGNDRVLQRLAQHEGAVGICFMSIAELFYGAEKSRSPGRNLDAIETLLLTLEIVHTDLEILKRFGRIKAQLSREGASVADADALIAAAALEKAERLITGNVRHFERIPGLVCETWA